MHDGAIWAAAGDRVEADLAQLFGFAPECFQLFDRRDLIELPMRRLRVEPSEEADHRRPIPNVSGTCALDLGRILTRL